MTTKNAYTFTSSNGTTPIQVLEWIPDGAVTGVVQIAHGVAEYIDRYDAFAEFLCSNGFVVVGNDHLGHGKSISNDDDLGFFGDHDGWNTVVDDIERLRQLTAKKWPDTPYFLLGHSMGSFLTRTHLIRYPYTPLTGVILSGTGHTPAPIVTGGRLMCRAEILKHGARYPSQKINDLAFGSYNKGFDPQRTDFEWLSGNEAVVNAYVADPLCGFVPTVGLFRDMMGGLAFISKRRNLEKMNKGLPVFFLSGQLDPVGGNGKGVRKVYKMFRSTGMKDIMCKFYENARHEILNERNKDTVYGDILSWIKTKLS